VFVSRPRPVRRNSVAVAAVAAVLAAVALVLAPAATAAPPAPVQRLDLTRYLGSWYQLAAVPQYFNLVCARDTRADYALDAQGGVAVHNTCTTWGGTPNEIRGSATVTDVASNAQLHVSFPGVPTQDQRYGAPNYIVTALGPDYSWALVTDPNRLSGFVLSRTPMLDSTQWAAVRAAIGAAGESDCLYLTSPTTGGYAGIAPLCSM
jgi:apolipoprotein D and lipocalin family protein